MYPSYCLAFFVGDFVGAGRRGVCRRRYSGRCTLPVAFLFLFVPVLFSLLFFFSNVVGPGDGSELGFFRDEVVFACNDC